MPYFCQFCDKEMALEQSVVYEKDYITCGSAACIAKAGKTSSDIAGESVIKTTKILIFKSPTPEDSATWRIISKKDYPDFLYDEEVLRSLVEGYVIGLQSDENTQPEMFYCARNTEQVLRQLQKDREQAGTS